MANLGAPKLLWSAEPRDAARAGVVYQKRFPMPGTTLLQNKSAQGANNGISWYSYNYVRPALLPVPLLASSLLFMWVAPSVFISAPQGGPSSGGACAQGPIHFLSYDSEVPYDEGTPQHACAPRCPSRPPGLRASPDAAMQCPRES